MENLLDLLQQHQNYNYFNTREILNNQDKKQICENQLQIRSQFSGQAMSQVSFGNTNVDSNSQQNICKKQLDQLKKIYLIDCKVNEAMENCVLYVKTFTPVARLVAVNLGVEDEKGDFILLTFYNSYKLNTQLKVLDSVFPIGTQIAIKNPYLKQTVSGLFVLRNDNPNNLEIIKKQTTTNKLTLLKDVSQNNEQIIKSSQNLKEMGNKNFQDNKFLEAINLYKQALDLLSKQKDSEYNELKTILYSNISQSYLNINQYQKALIFSELALKIDQKHLKSLGRQAQSLFKLNDFQKCLKVYKLIHEKINSTQKIQELNDLISRQEKGYSESDITFIQELQDTNRICPYQGPIQIIKTKKSGRGIIVTKDVIKNQVIIVDEVIYEPLNNKNQDMLFGYGFNSNYTIDKMSQLQLKSYLLERVKDDVALRKRISYLYKGESQKDLKIPDLSIYKYNYFSDEDENIVLSAEDIQQAINYNSFNFQSEETPQDSILDDKSSISPLISLINHDKNCNVKLVRTKDFVFAIAKKNIKKGDQIFIDYILKDEELNSQRAKSLKHWGIQES